MKKKRIVENDKAKILQTIMELDQKKNEALNLAWQKVSLALTPSFQPLCLFYLFFFLHRPNVMMIVCIKYSLI